MRVESRVPADSRDVDAREAASACSAPGDSRGSIDSESLLQGSRELIIRHAGQEYRLRHTQNDKLILTK